MKCSITECVAHNDCGILDITKKQPKNADACSYFKDQTMVEKKNRKAAKLKEQLDSKKKR